jgi:tryptophanyl-tRNA synthetase
VELTREVARRFNHLYGRSAAFEAAAAAALARLPRDDARYLDKQRKAFGETGSQEALARGEDVIRKAAAALPGWSRGRQPRRWPATCAAAGRTILAEPQALHTEVHQLPGLDGAKMSKSYGNAIAMREEPAQVQAKVQRMPTDPQRVRRTDPGDPSRCPVWQFHQVYSDADHARVGGQGLHQRRHRLPGVQAAGDRRHPCASRRPGASAPSPT